MNYDMSGVDFRLAVRRAKVLGEVRYGLQLEVTADARELRGTLEIAFVANEAGDVILDWRADTDSHSLKNVTVNGEAAGYEIVGDHLILKGLPHDEIRVNLDFQSPIRASGAGVLRFFDSESKSNIVYSLFVPSDASNSFPCFDQPDLKARFTLEMIVPAAWTAISNAKVVAATTVDESRKRWRFAESEVISTYLFAFVVGEFEALTDDAAQFEHTLYVRRSQVERMRPEAAEVFRLSRESIRFFEDYTKRVFPFSKYDVVVLPEFPFRGMEHAGATFLREEAIVFASEPTANDVLTRAELIAHENAHQWFGDLITMRWFDDLWIKEGLATLMSYKALEQLLTYKTPATVWSYFLLRTKSLAYATDATRGTTPVFQALDNLANAKSNYGNIVYRKAPSILRQLEFLIGAEAFREAIRRCVKKYEWQSLTWRDLIAAMSEASGRDLSAWGQEWIMQRGMTRVELELEVDNHQTISALALRQHDLTGDGKVRRMRTRVGVYNAIDNDDVRRLGSEEASHHVSDGVRFFEVELKDEVTRIDEARGLSSPLFVLANDGDYAYGAFPLDKSSLQFAVKHINACEAALTRAAMWSGMYQAMRAGGFAPGEFVSAVIANAVAELDDIALQVYLGWASVAFNVWLRDAEREHLAAGFEQMLIDGADNSPTTSRRAIFFRALLSVALTATASDYLKRRLTHKQHDNNDVLSMRDRFHVIAALYGLNDKDADELWRAETADATSDDTPRFAFAARAARADANTKRAYFHRFLHDENLAEGWTEAALPFFNHPRQHALTVPFLAQALAVVPQLKRTRKIFFVNNWLSSFLHHQVSDEAARIVREALNLIDEPDLRLKILEMSEAARLHSIR